MDRYWKEREEVGRWVIEFLTKVGHEDLLDVVRVEWSGRFTRRMGDALYKPAMNGGAPYARLRFSMPLWPRADEAERRNTVAHELAHLVTFHEWHTRSDATKNGRGLRFGKAPTAHGWVWRTVMRRMGERPERCHNVDRTGLKRKGRRLSRTPAYCGCDKVWELTPVRAARIRKYHPHAAYGCRVCKKALRLEKKAA
jgi:predicted SprT family Zn-dependent metalloprotease